MQFSLKLNGVYELESIKNIKIDLNWFKKSNMDMVDDSIEVHINDLLDIEDYVELNRKFNKLTQELISNFSSEERQKFYEYQKIDFELSSYQSSLAYYIALNKNSLLYKFII